MLKLVLDRGYKRNEFRVWSKLEGITECYFEVNMNDCALGVASFVVGDNTKCHLYVDYNVTDIKVKIVEPQCIEMSAGTDSSDDEAMRIRFDDIEDERTTVMDNGFEIFEMNKPKVGATSIEFNGNLYRFKMCASKSPIKKSPTKKGKVIVVTPKRIAKEIKPKDFEIMDKERRDGERRDKEED